MFLDGPFMSAPFMDFADPGLKWSAVGVANVSFVASTAWDRLLADTAPIIYLAAIEPGVLADRS